MVVTVLLLAIVVVATPEPGGLGTPTRVAAGTAAGVTPSGFEPSTFGTDEVEHDGLVMPAVAGFASSAPLTAATPPGSPTFRRFDTSLSSVRAAALGRFAAEAAAAAAAAAPQPLIRLARWRPTCFSRRSAS